MAGRTDITMEKKVTVADGAAKPPPECEAGPLYVLPAMRAGRGGDGRVILTSKFIEGVAAYARQWPGRVVACMRADDGAEHQLDHVERDPAELPFAIRWIAPDGADLETCVASAGLVLATLDERYTALPPLCRAHGAALVYVTEFSLKTRLQLTRAGVSNPFVRWRRMLGSFMAEPAQRRAARAADGIQCNGTVTFESHRRLNGNCLLYFDSRVTRSMLADEALVGQRTDSLLAGRPLRLLFSGRLIALKGVMHLPRVASQLRRRGVDFTLDICGGGDLESKLRAEIRREGLEDRVRLRGVMDFERELLPFVARESDLFVCCHPQSDPSCTYLETMSCGTPIIGYDNDAFRGLVKESGVGWLTPLGRPQDLADRIADLDRSRNDLAGAARASLAFASQHTFEQTMKQRVDHMLGCLRR